MTRVAMAVLVVALLIAAPAQAGKVKVYAPPGKAGTSQYSEVVPTSGGNAQTPAMGGGNTSPAQISKIGAGRAGVSKLSRLGKQGAAAAALAEATAPVVVRSAHGLGGQAGATASGSRKLTASSGGSALGGIGHLLAGSDAGGIGLFLPLLLAFGLGLAVAAAAVRLRRGREPGRPRA